MYSACWRAAMVCSWTEGVLQQVGDGPAHLIHCLVLSADDVGKLAPARDGVLGAVGPTQALQVLGERHIPGVDASLREQSLHFLGVDVHPARQRLTDRRRPGGAPGDVRQVGLGLSLEGLLATSRAIIWSWAVRASRIARFSLTLLAAFVRRNLRAAATSSVTSAPLPRALKSSMTLVAASYRSTFGDEARWLRASMIRADSGRPTR